MGANNSGCRGHRYLVFTHDVIIQRKQGIGGTCSQRSFVISFVYFLLSGALPLVNDDLTMLYDPRPCTGAFHVMPYWDPMLHGLSTLVSIHDH